MLKKPKVGQVVVTKNPDCCASGFPEGTIGKIAAISGSTVSTLCISVVSKDGHWYHCTKCLRRPKKGEIK